MRTQTVDVTCGFYRPDLLSLKALASWAQQSADSCC